MDIKKIIDDLVESGVELDDIAEQLNKQVAEGTLTQEQLQEALNYLQGLKDEQDKKKAFSLFGVE